MALRQLALAAGLLLWIDQLCIDQNNTAEQSQYVNMMGSIFRHAEQVIMWLGPDADDLGIFIHPRDQPPSGATISSRHILVTKVL